MDSPLSSRRNGAVDLCKAAAICAVLFIHCSANHFGHFSIGSLPWLATCFYGSVSRWAVPMFLLCSGALMNDPDRELSPQKLFGWYVPRLALMLAFWSALYCLPQMVTDRHAYPLSELLRHAWLSWLNGTAFYHLYYLFYAIGLYLALPLTRLIARHAKAWELRAILVLWGIAGVAIPFLRVRLPALQTLTAGSLMFYDLGPVFAAPGLGLLGWTLRRRPPKSWQRPALCFLLGLAATFAGTWVRSVRVGYLSQDYLSGLGPTAILMAVGLFQLAQFLASRREIPSAVRLLSRASTCVYLVHPWFQFLLRPAFFEAMLPYWSVPVQAALLLAVSLAAWAVARRVPLVREWLI